MWNYRLFFKMTSILIVFLLTTPLPARYGGETWIMDQRIVFLHAVEVGVTLIITYDEGEGKTLEPTLIFSQEQKHPLFCLMFSV